MREVNAPDTSGLSQESFQSIPLVAEILPNGTPSTENDDENEEEGEMITTVLTLLAGMLQMGNVKRSEKEETALRVVVLPALQIIAGGDRDSLVGQTAADVALLIMVRGAPEDGISSSGVCSASHYDSGLSAFASVCADAEPYLRDASPAMRGLGVRNIIVALREPEEVWHGVAYLVGDHISYYLKCYSR
jgi:hypothetical protein